MSEEEEKSAVEKAMEKDCIILVAVQGIIHVLCRAYNMEHVNSNLKCTGPDCAQYNQFANVCGLR